MRFLIAFVCATLLLCPNAHAAQDTAAARYRDIAAAFEELSQTTPRTPEDFANLFKRLQTLSAPGIPPKIQRDAALLSTSVLSYQYSQLESPAFANDKGGPAVLRRAIAICDQWLARVPDDYEFLVEKHHLTMQLGEPAQPILEQLLRKHPKRSWPHLLAALSYQNQDQLIPAMRENGRALALETNAQMVYLHMEKGIELARSLTCKILDPLEQIYADLPDTMRNGEASMAQPSAAEARQRLATMRSIRQRYLAAYDIDKCLASASALSPGPASDR